MKGETRREEKGRKKVKAHRWQSVGNISTILFPRSAVRGL
jgi:hypothetical protein